MVVVLCEPVVGDGTGLPVPVAGVVVDAVVSDPVAAPVVAVVFDAADSTVVDVVRFAFTAARLRSCVLLLSYLPSDNPLKLTQVLPSELSFSDIQSS